MSAGSLIGPLSISGSNTGTGVPNAGGSFYAYTVGTTTQTPIYSDAAATIAVSQPVTLDNAGRIPYATYPNGLYCAGPIRLYILAADGSTVISDTTYQTTAGAIAVGNTDWPNETTLDAVLTALGLSLGTSASHGKDGKVQVSTGAVAVSIRDYLVAGFVSVKAFNAKGDGTTDDTAACQAALTYVASLGSATLKFPAGTYKITSPLTLPSNTTGIALTGDGYGATIINQVTAVTDALDATGAASLTMRGIQFTGMVTLTSSPGVDVTDCQFGAGLTLATTAAVRSRFSNCIITKLLLNVSGAVVLVGCDFTGSPIVSLTGACGTVTAVGCTGSGGSVVWNAAATGSFYAVDCPQFQYDATALSSDPGIFSTNAGDYNHTVSLATGSPALVTVLTYFEQVTLNANSNVGAGQITPTPLAGSPLTGQKLIIHFINATGAAVTWNMGAWKIASAISTTDGNKTSVGFYYDGSFFREMWRAVTT